MSNPFAGRRPKPFDSCLAVTASGEEVVILVYGANPCYRSFRTEDDRKVKALGQGRWIIKDDAGEIRVCSPSLVAVEFPPEEDHWRGA